MSSDQPSKGWVLLNVLALMAYVALATYYLSAHEFLAGGIWAGSSVVWVYTILLSVQTYGNQCRIAAYRSVSRSYRS